MAERTARDCIEDAQSSIEMEIHSILDALRVETGLMVSDIQIDLDRAYTLGNATPILVFRATLIINSRNLR